MPCPPRRPARASASTAQSYPCLPPVFSCALPPASPAPAGFFLRPAGKADIGSEPARACAPRRPAPARPRSPCGLSLPDAGSVCRVALRAHPPLGCAHTLPARVSCAAYPCAPRVLPASSFCLRSAGRADIGRDTAPARPRRPARRRPRPPHSPIPPCRGFCPSAAGKADIGREPARAMPAASPCARPRSPCGLSLPAAGFFLRSAGRADIGREPARTVPAASPCAPARRRVLSVRRGKDGYWQGASAYRARRVTLRAARPRHPHSPIPPCRGFCPSAAGRADIGSEPARAVPAASPCARPRPPRGPIPPCRGFCPSAAGRVDIGREPARAVPAASPCPPARVLRAA